MNEEKFIRSARDVVDLWIDKETGKPRFGGEPGTAVPEVDPDDLKAVWDYAFEARKRMGPNSAIGATIIAYLCKPDADVQAVCYRSQMLGLIAMLVQTEQFAPNVDGTLDMKVFKAAAKVPLEWMEVGVVRKGFPVDVERFLQQCEAGG